MSQIPSDAGYVAEYRAHGIYRKPRKISRDGRPYWTYYAVVMDDLLSSWTLSGIKTQIGRMLNGLAPCDCDCCAYQIPETPLSPKHCGKALSMCRSFPYCQGFEVDKRRS